MELSGCEKNTHIQQGEQKRSNRKFDDWKFDGVFSTNYKQQFIFFIKQTDTPLIWTLASVFFYAMQLTEHLWDGYAFFCDSPQKKRQKNLKTDFLILHYQHLLVIKKPWFQPSLVCFWW